MKKIIVVLVVNLLLLTFSLNTFINSLSRQEPSWAIFASGIGFLIFLFFCVMLVIKIIKYQSK